MPRRIRHRVGAQRLPRRQPLLVALTNFRTLRKLADGQRAKHDPLAVYAHARFDRDRGMQPAAPSEGHEALPTSTCSGCKWRITATRMQQAATMVSTAAAGSPAFSARSPDDSVATV